MNPLNSRRPGPSREELISFILLILFSTTALLVWNFVKEAHDNESSGRVTAPVEQSIIQPEIKPDVIAETPLTVPIAEEAAAPPQKKVRIQTALITPPLPLFSIPMQTSVVNSNTGEVISTGRNSKIEIPARAFVDANGRIVEVNVEVNYREYHDFHDIFLSGIPMNYSNGSEDGMLESAGMIEINASQNGEQVYVNPQNKIRVMLASAYQSPDYNLYYLDQKENKWKVKGKDEVLLTDSWESRGSDGIIQDSTERRFTFTGRYYTVRVVCISDMSDRRKIFFSKVKSPEIFDFRFGKTKAMLPELKAFYGITWRYKGNDAQAVFMTLFKWDEMRRSKFSPTDFQGMASVIHDENEAAADKFRIILTSGDMMMSIPVTPQFRTEGAKRDFVKRLEKYSAAVAQRINDEQARFKQFKKDTADYFAANGRYVKSSASAEAVALRTFQIDNFGIWNCDKYFSPKRNSVIARFTDENGKKILIQHGYLVEKNRNSVYTVTNFNDFRFDPKEANLFWAILPGNKLAIISPEEFVRNKNKNDDICTFVMKVNDTALNSSANLRAALIFN